MTIQMQCPSITSIPKRFRSNDLNTTYLWHCRLGHINEKRISKLHQDGLLHSFDFESCEVCESCLLGKMTKAPFAGHSESVDDLLGFIHSDVCGPISSTARGGNQYFITFTYDYSRYGYLYMMKHRRLPSPYLIWCLLNRLRWNAVK